jgi:archaellum component FlaC
MADIGTMKDHIDDLMIQVGDLRAKLRRAEASVVALRKERDELSDELNALRSELIHEAVHGTRADRD